MPRSDAKTSGNEKDFVTSLSLMPLSPAAAARAGELSSSSLNWEAVLELAARWQVEATVFANLRSNLADRIPAEILTTIAQREQTARAHALSRTLLTDELVRDFARNEIPVLVFKGPALAAILYGDCTRRPFGDLDLLIHREDMRRAHEFLIAREFKPSYRDAEIDSLIEEQHALELGGPNLKVELHWSLLSRFLRFDIAESELWDRAQNVQCADFTLRTLWRPHHFLYLCAHGAKHEWSRFRWIVDVAQFARKLNDAETEEIIRLARETNSRRILTLALALTSEVFDEAAPSFPRVAYTGDRATTKMVQGILSSLGLRESRRPGLVAAQIERVHPYVRTLRFWIRTRERIEDRVVAVARLVFRRVSP